MALDGHALCHALETGNRNEYFGGDLGLHALVVLKNRDLVALLDAGPLVAPESRAEGGVAVGSAALL